MKELSLEHSDVVFMYTPRDTAVYEEYGATMNAWGGAHTLDAVVAAKRVGVHPTGTMWCLTAGASNLHTDPDLAEATVRDIEGNRISVPWLPDHVHEGTPSWWGCGNHPSFRAHMRKTVCDAMKGGASGLHIDDHLSTAHPAAYEGGCFCDHCMELFAEHLRLHGTPEMAATCGLTSFDDFDYRAVVRQYARTRAEYKAIQQSVPLRQEYVDFQLTRASRNVQQLGHLAQEIVGRPITLSANTGLPDIHHTVVTPHLTHLVGEVHHQASSGTAKLMGAVRAYRMAEALGKPLAATAAGSDWDYVLEHKRENLVRLWIALSYACGQRLMVPHHMWCFSPALGTRWYDGPAAVYAPLYRFIRANRELFDEVETAGPLRAPHTGALSLETNEGRLALKTALDAGAPQPMVAAEDDSVWVFPREGPSGAVLHVLNLHYDAAADSFDPQHGVTVAIPQGTLRGTTYCKAVAHSFDAVPTRLHPVVTEDQQMLQVRMPELRLWTVIELEEA